MDKDEAQTLWREATEELERVKARHKSELADAKRRFAETRDAFIDAVHAERRSEQQ